jgi:hypothetical protein
MVFGNDTEVNDSQYANVEVGIIVTLSGMTIEFKFVHSQNILPFQWKLAVSGSVIELRL